MVRHLRVLSVVTTACLLIFISTSVSHARAIGTTKVEYVDIQPSGGWIYEAGFDWETGRTLGESGGTSEDYDNIRIIPLSLKYGLNDWIELGGDLGYSSNSEDNSTNNPDEGGFEGITLSSKFKWNQNVATTFELGFMGDDEVYPYSNDGLNFGLNIPMQMSLGPGTLNGELGYTVQSGDAQVGMTVNDRENYLNYGIGYVYEVNRTFGLAGELRGHGETVENGESFLDLVLGVPVRISETSHLKPAFTFGLSDGSPDFALGLDYGMEFGNQQRYESAQDSRQGDRLSTDDRRPYGDQSGQEGQDPLVMPEEEQPSRDGESRAGEQDGQKDRITPPATYDPQKAAEFAQRGRRAFEQGNYQRAIEQYTEAARLDPGNVEYQSNLGSLHYRQQNYDKSKEHYQKAIQIDPRDYFSHLYLGATHYQLGDDSQAREHFQRVLEIQPGNQQAQDWLNRLD